MRYLAVDFGQRRIGLAVSDASGMLARPWKTVAAGRSPAASAGVIAALVAAETGELGQLDALGGIVVGLPRRLSGEDTTQSAPARVFGEALGAATRLEIFWQDERLTSHEAEMRLAEREPDWRKRKALIDAAAAAIILQDFLDARADRLGREGADSGC
jgi:putative holliday junction resolvase